MLKNDSLFQFVFQSLEDQVDKGRSTPKQTLLGSLGDTCLFEKKGCDAVKG